MAEYFDTPDQYVQDNEQQRQRQLAQRSRDFIEQYVITPPSGGGGGAPNDYGLTPEDFGPASSPTITTPQPMQAGIGDIGSQIASMVTSAAHGLMTGLAAVNPALTPGGLGAFKTPTLATPRSATFTTPTTMKTSGAPMIDMGDGEIDRMKNIKTLGGGGVPTSPTDERDVQTKMLNAINGSGVFQGNPFLQGAGLGYTGIHVLDRLNTKSVVNTGKAFDPLSLLGKSPEELQRLIDGELIGIAGNQRYFGNDPRTLQEYINSKYPGNSAMAAPPNVNVQRAGGTYYSGSAGPLVTTPAVGAGVTTPAAGNTNYSSQQYNDLLATPAFQSVIVSESRRLGRKLTQAELDQLVRNYLGR